MLQYDFEESVFYWLILAQQAYMRAFNSRLAPHGITYRQMQVLAWSIIDGPLTQADLAAKMFIEPPSLVGVLDRMERSGWIARQACPEDRRKKYIVIQPAAEEVWNKIAAIGRDLRAQATEGLTRTEVVALKKLLARVRKNVSVSPVSSIEC